jgi:hypothetical protein
LFRAYSHNDSESRKAGDGTLENFRSEASVGGGVPPHCNIVLPRQANGPEHMTLDIAPHSILSNMQKRVMRIDSGMANGKTSIVVRSALFDVGPERVGFDIYRSGRGQQDQEFGAQVDGGAG